MRTIPLSEESIKFRLPADELEHLEAYCLEHRRTKTEVLREFIRSLPGWSSQMQKKSPQAAKPEPEEHSAKPQNSPRSTKKRSAT